MREPQLIRGDLYKKKKKFSPAGSRKESKRDAKRERDSM